MPFTSQTIKSILVTFFCFFLVTLSIGTLSQIESGWVHFVRTTIEQHSIGWGDTNRYTILGQYFANLLPETPEYKFYSTNWTPGYPFLLAIILKLTGKHFYLPKILILCSVWLASAFTLLFYWIPFHKNKIIRFMTWSSLLILPNFRWWAFQEGFTLSEPYTLVLFLFAWTFLFKAIEKESKNLLIWSGILFSLTAYFRAAAAVMVEITCYSTIAVVGLLFGVFYFLKKYYFFENKKFNEHYLILKKTFFGAIIIFSVYSVSTFPWKYRNKSLTKSFSMGPNSNSIYDVHWKNSEELDFYLHTANASCVVDPKLCSVYRKYKDELVDYKKQLTFLVFFSHPLSWYKLKLKNFTWIWMGSSFSPNKSKLFDWSFRLFEGILYLSMGFLAFIRLKKNKIIASDLLKFNLITFTVMFIIAHLVVLTIAHFEDRYAWFLRIYFFWLFLFVYSKKETNPILKGN